MEDVRWGVLRMRRIRPRHARGEWHDFVGVVTGLAITAAAPTACFVGVTSMNCGGGGISSTGEGGSAEDWEEVPDVLTTDSADTVPLCSESGRLLPEVIRRGDDGAFMTRAGMAGCRLGKAEAIAGATTLYPQIIIITSLKTRMNHSP